MSAAAMTQQLAKISLAVAAVRPGAVEAQQGLAACYVGTVA